METMGAERPTAIAAANTAEPAARTETNPTGYSLSAPPLDVVVVLVVEWVILEVGGVEVGELVPVPVLVCEELVRVRTSPVVDVVLSETVEVKGLVVVVISVPVAFACNYNR